MISVRFNGAFVDILVFRVIILNMNNINLKRIGIIFYLFFFVIIIYSCKAPSGNKTLHINHMGKEITKEVLDFNPSTLDESDIRYITIENNKDKNILAITNKTVACTFSNCHNQVCVHKGTISNQFDNDLIVCMPHQLIVYYE